MRGELLGAAAFALALVAALLLMPSSAEDGGEVGALSSDGDADPGARPTWRVGDAWRVQFGDNDPICWLVVARADAEGYQQGVWCPTDEAPMIATQLVTTAAPFAGDLTPELAVRTADEPVEWFEWPLKDGKSWGTTWGGEAAQVSATWDEETRRFVMALCLDEGDCIASYDFDPELGWWREIDFNAGLRFRVHERVSDWDDGYVLATSEEKTRYMYNGVSIGAAGVGEVTGGPSGFTMRETEDLIVVEVRREGAYFHELALEAPDGSFAWADSRDSFTRGDSYVADSFESRPGDWSIRDTGVAPGMLRVRIWGVMLVEA